MQLYKYFYCFKKCHFLTIFETSRFAFTQSPYFSLWVSKSNLDDFKTRGFDSAQNSMNFDMLKNPNTPWTSLAGGF